MATIDATADLPAAANLIELFLQRVAAGGDQPVYHFIEAEHKPIQTLTYAQLGQRVKALAAALQARNAAGEPVILLCPPGLNYMVAYWACVMAGAIAVPAYPPVIGRLEKTLPRLEAILSDCKPVIALAQADLLGIAGQLAERSEVFAQLIWLDVAAVDESLGDRWQQPNLAPNDVAFLQYTSGSTSTPKGVMVSHANILHNSRAILQTVGGQATFVSWLPPYHDMGLIGTIIQVVYGAGWGYFMAPTTFLRYPALWLQTIARTGAAVSVAPNFGYDHCVNKIPPEQVAELDLSRWQHAFSGAEPVRAATLDAFAQHFAPAGFRPEIFRPCYGLAEATLQVTSACATEPARRLRLNPRALEMRKVSELNDSSASAIESVACGFPVDATEVAIVDPDTCKPCGAGAVGEIWVNSPSVALGYWKRPEQSMATFYAAIEGEQNKTYLRTGDLGFVDAEGELHITGRIKDVIVLRGRNLYPNDIELIAQGAYSAVRGKAVAFGIQVQGREELVLVMEATDTSLTSAARLVAAARKLLAEEPLELTPHAILVVRSGAIPQTSSGKLQRHAARAQFLALGLKPLFASVLPSETQLPLQPKSDDIATWFADYCTTTFAATHTHDNLPELGVDYAALVNLVETLEQQAAIRLSVGALLMEPTLAQLQALATGASRDAVPLEQPAAISGPVSRALMSEAELQQWLVGYLAARLDLPAQLIDLDTPFASLGLDSAGSVDLAQALAQLLQIKIPETLVWDAPTLRAAAAHLLNLQDKTHRPAAIASPAVGPTAPADEPIAIVGIGCRFPQAADVEAFWKLLVDGRDAVSLVPPGRWDGIPVGNTKSGAQVSEWGGFIDQIDGFEPAFFGLSPREVQRMDPQQRLLLEVSWEALEHGGINPRSLAGTETGVFVAISNQEYWSLQLPQREQLDIHACTGSAGSVAANRISYLLDLRGPSMAVDTACSGSLVSVHLACESLRRGESNLALAGGVNLMVKPDLNIAFTEAQMLSPRGRCSTFDDAADGYVRGEGCGLIVLQRLSDAQRAGNPIIAAINGSAVSHDGRSNGLTAPNPQAQSAVIQRALRMSGFAPEQVGYVEAHGTGTPLGDPIETRVLADIYGAGRADSPCLIGSVKTNIGHLESAAGIAGLIKAALAVERDLIPAHLHFQTPNRAMDWTNSGLAVASGARPWQSGESRVAGVSSFGFGGTLAHVLLSSAPPVQRQQAPDDDWHLLPLSAREQYSLEQQLANLQRHLQAHPEQALGDICYTAATGRASFPLRAALVGKNRTELLHALAREQAALAPLAPQSLGARAFCFSGQGSQYVAMAPTLLAREPVFAAVIDQCDQLIAPALSLSLRDLLGKNPTPQQLQDTRIQQPLLYSLQVALARLWMSWGVTPQLLLGHSVGEYAAMHIAGVFSLEDGLRLVLARAKAMAEQPQLGGMLACLGDLSQLEQALKPFKGSLWIAANNSPENKVVAGYHQALLEFAAAPHPGFETRTLRVSNAFHSPLIAAAGEPLRALAETIALAAPKIPCITNLGGELLTQAPAADHFARHLFLPVDFQDSVQTALAEGAGTFIEIGPGRSLLNFCRLQAAVSQCEAVYLPSLLEAKSDAQVLLESLARYWTLGGQVDWEQFHHHTQRKHVAMPTYPFSRTSHWLDANEQLANHQSSLAASTSVASATGADLMESTLALFRTQNAIWEKLATAGSASHAASEPATGQASALPALTGLAAPLNPVPAGRALVAERNDIQQQVMQFLARIAGCRPADISLNDRLNTTLGLDSLMRTELDKVMLASWPPLAQVDRTQLGEDPSVQNLLDLVCAALGIHPSSAPAVSLPVVAPAAAEPLSTIVPETDFEQSEAYRALMARLDLINAVGANPYGRIHEGFNSGHATLDGKSFLNFASFNYLSLSNHPEVIAAAKEAIDTYGTSPSATPLLFGETPLHQELEAEIASYLGTEAAVVFASGHGTSVAVIGHVMGPEDLIIHDQYIHDCAIRGAILSGAKRRSFSHDNWEELDRVLAQVRNNYRRVLIIIEGVYSQDGDIGSLPEFIAIKKKHQCMLMIDEAHSIGVLGKTGAGAGDHFGVDRRDVDIWMGTLSKGLGSCGGYIASSKNFIRFLKYTTPLLIFSTGITPANAAAALQSIRVLRKHPERVHALQEKFRWFLQRAKALGFNTGPSFDSPVIPIIVGSWEKAMILSDMLRAKQINVMPIGYPAVEKDKCRLRFFVNIDHTHEELEFALQSLAQAMSELNEKDQEAQLEAARA